jgi:dTMP kinase
MPFGAALRSRGFRRLLIGQAVSSLGDWVATLAFIAAAFALTGGNQTAVGVVLVLRLVPPIFAAPVGGVVADRWSRRSGLVTSDLARGALIAVVPFVDIVFLYVIAFLHECISLFFLPARDSSVPDLVPEGSREEANGLILASSYGSIPIAAALFGGLRILGSNLPTWMPFADLLRDHPMAFAFLFDSATFLFSAGMIATLQLDQRRHPQRMELFRDMVEGFRYIVHEPTLRSLAYGLVVSMFGGGVLFAVGIGYVNDTLGGNDVAFGWLAALWGVGMGIGLLLVRALIKERGRAIVFTTAVAACGGVLIFMALVPVLWIAFIAAVVFGTVFSIAVVVALTMAQETAEERFRGRMMGGVQMLFRLGLGVGALGIGALAHSVDRLTAIVTLDGNQVGLVAGGVLILLGSAAASGVIRRNQAFGVSGESGGRL